MNQSLAALCDVLACLVPHGLQQMFIGSGDGTTSTISVDDLRIELKAGGLSHDIEDQIVRRCDSSAIGVVRVKMAAC